MGTRLRFCENCVCPVSGGELRVSALDESIRTSKERKGIMVVVPVSLFTIKEKEGLANEGAGPEIVVLCFLGRLRSEVIAGPG